MTEKGYHETGLSEEAKDFHRALSSVQEELEAIDWYNQRADVSTDEALKAVLLHNRDEEMEHAAMGLEYLRRRIPRLDACLRTYLFTSAPIDQLEVEATGGGAGGAERGESGGGKTESAGASASSGLGIGKLE